MIYFIIGVIIFNALAIYILKSLHDYLKFSSVITIVAGYATIGFNYILKYIINREFSIVNVSKVTDIIYKKTIDRGLILILIGGLELIIYIIIKYYNKYSHMVKIVN